MLRTTISNLKIFTGNILIVSIITSGLYALIAFEAPTTHAASKTLSDISTMQEMTQTICAKSKVGDTATLTDTRDNNTYTIRKHEDNNCWMTQNLRLAGEKTLTPADSDVASDYTLPASDINGFSASNYYASQMYYAGDEANGAYYSWTAATAGTGDENLTEGDAPSSVCPKGWKLPPNNGNGSYANFAEKVGITDDTAGSTKISSAPYNFPYTGNIYYSTLRDPGLNGNYWSRTVSSSSSQGAYYLWFNSSNINPVHNRARFRGYSIRCVALGGIATDSNLSVEVYPALMIDAVSNMHQIVDSSMVNTGTISTTITANTNYQVLLSSNDAAMRNPKFDSTDNRTIPTISNTTPTILTPGTSAWGIATGSPDGSSGNSTYVGITTTPQSYYNTTSLGAYPSQTIHTYGIGVTISPLLPSGIYSTSITVTAVGV